MTLAAAISWVNHRFLKLPQNVGLVIVGLALSLCLASITAIWGESSFSRGAVSAIQSVDFSRAVLDGMLGFLLFAGALQIDLQRLRDRAWGVAALATLGVAVTSLIVGIGLWLAAQAAEIPFSFSWAMVFGTLIAPTDPVAVLATLRSANPPPSLEMDMAGEALFNDGVAVVLFTVALMFASGSESPTALRIAQTFAVEAGGGAALGLAAGYVAYRAMHSIDDYPIEVMISIALVMATYAVADALGTSGPIAVVVAGVLIGNRGARHAMSDQTKRYVFGFWKLVDDTLNALLFLLIGLEVLLLSFDPYLGAVATVAIPLALVARFVSVAGAVWLLRPVMDFVKGTIPILTWGSVRGGISIALALSVENNESRSFILAATYNVVLFTVIVQGLTLGRLVRRLIPEDNGRERQGAVAR
jgi:CPA1 family monovalent cation:H+ antiporter